MKAILFSSLMVLSCLFAGAQEITFENYVNGDYLLAQLEEESQGAALNQLGEDAKIWNYGKIVHKSTGYRYFKFTNTGDAPLVISNAKGSCGCTVPTWPREPILPGKSGFIKVKYDTNRQGPFTKYVTLNTNSLSNGTTKLTIKGNVEKVAAAPTLNAK